MRKIIGAAFVSLDGVMQAPGGPTEDPTNGFRYGGWLAPFFDEDIGAQIGSLFNGKFDLLLGRRTYDIFAAYWPYADDGQKDIRDPFNACTKYVLTHGDEPLAWENSERAPSIEAVRAIKDGDGPDLVIQGSSTLYPQLLKAGLIDRLILMIFPVVLGEGKRIFGPGTAAKTLRAIDQTITSGGNIIATYEPAGPVATIGITAPSSSDREQARQAAMADGSW